jgi:hypothetical protein
VATIWVISFRDEASSMTSEKIPVYAVVRLDKYFHQVEEQIAVQAVLPTIEEAEAEVARLNSLRDPSRVIYFLRATRYYPRGRSTPST